MLWLLAATTFEWLYKPAQQGRKVAYLTVASFVFLAVVMALVLAGNSQHSRPRADASFKFQVPSFQLTEKLRLTGNLKHGTWNCVSLPGGPT